MADGKSIIDLHILGAILQSQISNRMPHSHHFSNILVHSGQLRGIAPAKICENSRSTGLSS